MEALSVSQAVMDDYAARILMGTAAHAASARDLSRQFRIPIAACYRRLRELQRAGLVFCERELPAKNGKGLQLFRSRIRSLRVAIEGGRMRAFVEYLPSENGPADSEQELNLEDGPHN